MTIMMAPLKHKFKAAFIFVLPILLAVAAAFYLPKSYRSDAMIFVRLGRESVSLDPTASAGSIIPVFESRENEVNSIRDMLYSGGLSVKVVDRIGPEVILGNEPLGEVPDTFPDPPEGDVKGSPRQLAIKLLNEKISIVNSRKSSVIVTSCEAKSPKLAQKILEVYMDAYKQMHSLAHQTSKSNHFFEQQTDLLKTQWKDALEKLRQAKANAGVVSISGMQENLKTQSIASQSRLMQVERELMTTEKTLNTLTELSKKPMNARGVREDLKKATVGLASLQGERATLERQIKQLVERAAKLNSDEVIVRQLEEEVSTKKATFLEYQELYEQTRIDEELRSNKFTNVRVVQEPSFVPKPVSPKKKIVIAAGVFVGATGAILVSLLFELFLSKPLTPGSSTVRRPNESSESAPDPSLSTQGSLI